jgi:hypothetical protein
MDIQDAAMHVNVGQILQLEYHLHAQSECVIQHEVIELLENAFVANIFDPNRMRHRMP